jgi:hypothetical protein
MELVTNHEGLVGEYIATLRLWSESRALYPANNPVVRQLTDQVEELEARLKQVQKN